MIDLKTAKEKIGYQSEYEKRIKALNAKGFETNNIEEAVDECIKNIDLGCNSFVVYGEPQCGKTELMIALSARLIDEGKKIIVVLLNDDTDLLQQNLQRFRTSSINPTPHNYIYILDQNIGERNWIIFCKKNINDLTKLNISLSRITDKIIIDDEGDYASPNGKVNKADKTKINAQIHKLFENNGIYIGVTATPARLDLNNTFDNLTEKWVRFNPHSKYIGKEKFFPIDINTDLEYSLNRLPETGDKPEHLRKAIASFVVNTSILNINNRQSEKYCFLIHASGAVDEHSKDKKDVDKYFETLNNSNDSNYERYWNEIRNIIFEKCEDTEERDKVFMYALSNISNHQVVVLNSKNKSSNIGVDTTNPSALFSIFIGGNKVSRGITFGNLLGMFFTRDAQKIQQDTYIQRARMFGNRLNFLNYFELWITESLYIDWHRCFIYHYLSLKSIEANNGAAPVWIGSDRINPVAASSIDKSTLVLDKGEMAFPIFEYNENLKTLLQDKSNENQLRILYEYIGDTSFPKYILEFIKHNCNNLQKDVNIFVRKLEKTDIHDLRKNRGVLGGADLKGGELHHLAIIYNDNNESRLIYKYNGKVHFFRKSRKG